MPPIKDPQSQSASQIEPHVKPKTPRKTRGAVIAASFFSLGALVALFFVAFASGPNKPSQAADVDSFHYLQLFGDVFSRVRKDYVRPADDSDLIESALNGMLSSLDPHSAYLNPKNYGEMQIRTRGAFGGLGIEFTLRDGLVHVITPIDDTPAQRAGVLSGDVITHLDGLPIANMSLDDAVKHMRGQPGSSITLTIRRAQENQPAPTSFDVNLVRAVIQIRAVKHKVIDDVAYLRISAFNENTSKNLKSAVNELKNHNPKPVGYILDLRNNPGGLLSQAIAASDLLLDRGEIVSTRGRDPQSASRYNAKYGQLIRNQPIVVLINGGAASASEIMAGALQDQRRAILIGSRSFGKGSIQNITPLRAGGALKLTTALYYTPSGRSIQAEGIEPDILVNQPAPNGENASARSESSLARHIANPSDDPPQNSEKSGSASFVPTNPDDDVQLQYALNLLKNLHKNSQADASQ